jgi:hypothetical protein
LQIACFNKKKEKVNRLCCGTSSRQMPATKRRPRRWGRKTKTRGRIAASGAVASDEYPAVTAFEARDDTPEHPWIHLKKTHSKRQALAADARGVGYYRAISHPFLWKGDASPKVEIKWIGFGDEIYQVMEFQDVARQFNEHQEFWRSVSIWIKQEWDSKIVDSLHLLLGTVPVSCCMVFEINKE